MKRRFLLASIMIVMCATGCSGNNQSTSLVTASNVASSSPLKDAQSSASDSHKSESNAESVSVPKKALSDVLHDVVSYEDDMTGDKAHYSSKAFYKTQKGLVLPINGYDDHVTFTPISLYLYESGDTLDYRLIVSYMGDHWIFFDNWMVKVDEEDPVTFSLSQFSPSRDTMSGGIVYEKYSLVPGTDMIDVLEKAASSKSCKMRLYGKDKKYDFELGESEKAALAHIISMYKDYS